MQDPLRDPAPAQYVARSSPLPSPTLTTFPVGVFFERGCGADLLINIVRTSIDLLARISPLSAAPDRPRLHVRVVPSPSCASTNAPLLLPVRVSSTVSVPDL